MLYKTVFIIGYYGLLRIGEMAAEPGPHNMNHAIKAKDVHIGQNKQKILLVVYSSKTHGKESRSQKIKIESTDREKTRVNDKGKGSVKLRKRHFCPFTLLRQYFTFRGPWNDLDEQLFVFRHGIPLMPTRIRKTFKSIISNLGLDASCYDIHLLRVGRRTDLIKSGMTVEEVQRIGRWKSNAIYKYIKD